MSSFGNPLTENSPQADAFEYPQSERVHPPPVFNENQEMELTADLLEVNDEQGLEQVLSDLIRKVGELTGSFVHPLTSQAIGNNLKSVAKQVLPWAGRTSSRDYVEGAVGGSQASVAGHVLGLELEGLSTEDSEFEATRQFVRFAAETVKSALQAPPNTDPAVVAAAAATEAARMHAPGLLNGAFWEPGGSFQGEFGKRRARRPPGLASPRHTGQSSLSITDVDPGDEPSLPCAFPSPPDYHFPPAELLADPKKGVVANDSRLNSMIRLHAQMRDPRMILANAVMAYLGTPVTVGAGPFAVKIPMRIAPKHAQALAQLAVTGRESFGKFNNWRPQTPDLIRYVQQVYRNQRFNPSALQSAASAMLDSAYSALWAVRANETMWRAYRSKLGWIAASGEDDLPHRPVNVYTAPYPQYDLPVGINGVVVMARYMLASALTSLAPSAPSAAPKPGQLRSIPSDRPNIPAQNKIVVYIHGHGSRLEEAVPLANELIKAGLQKGQSYTVISLDLLNSGYGTPADWSQLQIGNLSYHPSGDPKRPIQTNLTYGCPVLDTEEQFIINFIEALDQQIGNVKNRIVAVIGGSLGGLMCLRLSRRNKQQHPFLATIVAWSPACVWGYNSFNAASAGHQILGVGGDLIGKYKEAEKPSSRHDFLDKMYHSSSAPGLPPQPQMWYHRRWRCRNQFVEQSLFDRFEYYTPQYRRWTIRLAYEMLLFSFTEGDVYVPNKAQGPPRYLSMTSRILLSSWR